MNHSAATNQIVVFVRVYQTFTTIWLSRSSEVKIKVTRDLVSKMTIFKIYLLCHFLHFWCVWMWFRAERLLEEYAEAKLALLNTDLRSAGHQPNNDDDDDDDDTSHYSSRNPAYLRGRESRRSSSISAQTGPKYHQCRDNPASLRARARRNPASRENSASRENRGTKSIGKHPDCTHVRSPLGVISQQDNLLVLGHSALPPLPSERLLRHCGYLDN